MLCVIVSVFVWIVGYVCMKCLVFGNVVVLSIVLLLIWWLYSVCSRVVVWL